MKKGMNAMVKWVVFSILFIITVVGNAQPAPSYTITERKAIKKYEAATDAYKERNYDEAKIILTELVKTHPDFAEAHFLLAQLYIEEGNMANAIPELEKGANLHAEIFPESWLILAEGYMSDADYKKAEAAVSKFMPYPKHDAITEKKANLILASCVFAQKAMKYPVAFEPENLGDGVNTEFDEYYPCITADETTLLFTRLVPDDRTSAGKQEDFFISRKDKGGVFAPAQPILSINTAMNEGAPSLSADGNTLIFTACQTVDGQWGDGRTGVGSCDLFYTIKVGNDWAPGKNMGNSINTGAWESQPSYSADGRTMYFVRGKTTYEGVQQQDIYYSFLRDNGEWTKPEKVRGMVNTDFQEESVMIHPDGSTLYFSSNGHPGMGGMDIFMSRREVDGSWGKPINLGYPINTSKDENSFHVTAEGQYALFASERPGGKGGLDLYRFKLPEFARPMRVSYVEGIVSDKVSYKKLEAKLELVDMETGKVVANTYSNQGTGDFLLCLPPGKDYVLNVSKDGYLFYTDRFTLSNEIQTKPVKLLVPLQKIKVGTKISIANTTSNGMKNVFFDSNSDVLKKESYAELNKLVDLLNKNPERKIEVGGHTDDVGDDAANMLLSQKRAESVKQYLVKSGIVETRIVAKGYGETQPQVANDTDANRSKNRRTEFVIIE
jgi:outer membrane protein OmpA-like peptidoglycan-associated protein